MIFYRAAKAASVSFDHDWDCGSKRGKASKHNELQNALSAVAFHGAPHFETLDIMISSPLLGRRRRDMYHFGKFALLLK